MIYALLLTYTVTVAMLVQDINNRQAGVDCRLHVLGTHAGSRY